MKHNEVEFERIVGHKLEYPDDEEIGQGKLTVKKVSHSKLYVEKVL